jgi:hypothetical protein
MASDFPTRPLRQRIKDWRYYERERWHRSNFPSRRVRQYLRAWRYRRSHRTSEERGARGSAS